ncbi:MAG: Choline dehydrogenase [Bradyrhizobium sp.]|jgi:choline dehydrogenase|nr:Choline dehydrogenase [Bradyrhizobium sp.]
MKKEAQTQLGTFDYVIIGAGSAGCVLANRLSADPSLQVCLLEAGGKDSHPWIHIPVGYFFNFDHPRADWRYRTEPEPGLNGRVLKYPRGRVLGGSSSINGMVYIRGHALDYDGWRQLGNVGWSWSDVLPYFKRSENQVRGPSDAHGADGELSVDDLRASWEILETFRKAAIETGIPATDDFNGGESEGVGYFQVTQKNGRRMSAARAFLKPAAARPNLTILTGCLVQRIRFAEKRAVGVEVLQDGVPAYVPAQNEVILSAGAVGSPQILQLSGIGAPSLLQSHGIEVRHAASRVGEGLQDHPAVRMMFKVKNTRTLNDQLSSWTSKAAMVLEYALRRSGPLTIPPALVNAFVKSDRARAAPDLQYVVYPLTYDTIGEPAHKFSAFTGAICLVRPESRGSIRIASSDAATSPEIRLNFLTNVTDVQAAMAGIRGMRRVCAAEAFRPYEVEEFRPGPEFVSDEQLAAAAKDITATIFHPTSTCGMGPDNTAVVDSRLRVRGVDRLRVVDASVMPMIISGNTNAATIMIAEKASDMIREDSRLKVAASA